MLFALIGFFLLWGVSDDAIAGTYTVNRKSQWERWTYPKDLVILEADGRVHPTRMRRRLNATLNADQFEHPRKPDNVLVKGGISTRLSNDPSYRLPSNVQDVGKVIDGRSETWWQPRPEDDLRDWWVEIDLGRVVLAERIRLIFPDGATAKPFRFFSIYVSEGVHTVPTADVFQFRRIGTTVRANTARVVEYELSTLNQSMATGENLVKADVLPFVPLQYIRVEVEEKMVGGALAEIEVEDVGDNVALGTLGRGGSVRSGQVGADRIFDGSIDGYWGFGVTDFSSWLDAGRWAEWDLGAVFYVDQIVLVGPTGGRTPFWYYNWSQIYFDGYVLMTSDGSRLAVSGGGQTMSNFEYELLSEVDNRAQPKGWLFSHVFPRRRVRYIFWHDLFLSWSYNGVLEMLVYGEGYPAEVEMLSDFIDLGEVKSLTEVRWEAETPVETGIRIQTRTGDTFQIRKRYFTAGGQEITEEAWKKLPPRARGEIKEERETGADWSGWSEVYTRLGEEFRSPTPRRYVQLKVALATQTPDIAPTLRSIGLHFFDPLIRGGVMGTITPREAAVGKRQVFVYTLQPKALGDDPGFDQVLVRVLAPAEEVSVKVGGRIVQASSSQWGDSLIVQIPTHVTREAVVVTFTTRVSENPTTFEAAVMSSRNPGVWQRVDPAESEATAVFLPAVAGEEALIRNVEVEPGVLTPDGNGVNDVLTVVFDVVKGAYTSEVTIATLQGRVVTSLVRRGEGRVEYRWDGWDRSGGMVSPGVYICRIRVKAEVGVQSLEKVVYVVY